MDWNQIRQQWQQQATNSEPEPLARLQARDEELRRQVRRRDRTETLAAYFVAVAFGLFGALAFARGSWFEVGCDALLVAWGLFIPHRLRRARAEAPVVQHGLPLHDFLVQQREAALTQARLLERAWLWYVAPCTVGLIGLAFAYRSPPTVTAFHVAVVVVLGIAIAWLNHHVARTTFRVHAARLQQQIDELEAAPTA